MEMKRWRGVERVGADVPGRDAADRDAVLLGAHGEPVEVGVDRAQLPANVGEQGHVEPRDGSFAGQQ